MVVLGIDAHKRNHTVVAIDDKGRKLAERGTGTTTADHLALLTWAEKFGADREWAVRTAGTCPDDSNGICSPPASVWSAYRRS